MAVPRLMVEPALAAGLALKLETGQARYLTTVMRLSAGADVLVFNGRDGEWRALLRQPDKRTVILDIAEQTRAQRPCSDVHVLFAPLKKTRTDFLVEKTTELGAARLQPVFTRRTVADRVNLERLTALAREAAEQSERLDAPDIATPARLEAVLDLWRAEHAGRRLLFCDEASAHGSSWAREAGAPAAPSKLLSDVVAERAGETAWALLIGPEGGFAPEERARLHEADFTDAVSLGPRVLRADTAAVAALTLWMAHAGDWRASAHPS